MHIVSVHQSVKFVGLLQTHYLRGAVEKTDNEELVMMNDVYEKFLKSSEEFIFAENKPENLNIIFVPGNGYPQMAEKAAELFKKGMADWILPSGKYSVVNGSFQAFLKKAMYIIRNMEQNGNFSGMFL